MKRKALNILIVASLLLPLSGCTVHLKGNGEWGWQQTSRWAFYQDTDTTPGECLSASSLQPLVDYFIQLQESGVLDDAGPVEAPSDIIEPEPVPEPD